MTTPPHLSLSGYHRYDMQREEAGGELHDRTMILRYDYHHTVPPAFTSDSSDAAGFNAGSLAGSAGGSRAWKQQQAQHQEREAKEEEALRLL